MLNGESQRYTPGSCIVQVHLSSIKKFRERKNSFGRCHIATSLWRPFSSPVGLFGCEGWIFIFFDTKVSIKLPFFVQKHVWCLGYLGTLKTFPLHHPASSHGAIHCFTVQLMVHVWTVTSSRGLPWEVMSPICPAVQSHRCAVLAATFVTRLTTWLRRKHHRTC